MSKKPIQMELPLSKTRTSHLRAGALRTKEAVVEAAERLKMYKGYVPEIFDTKTQKELMPDTWHFNVF